MKKSPVLLLSILIVCVLSFNSYLYLEISNNYPEEELAKTAVAAEGNLPKAGAALIIGKAISAIQRSLVK